MLRQRRAVRTVLVLLAVVGLVAAGCGGGGDSSGKPLTKAEYQSQLQQLSNEVGVQLRRSIGASTTLKKSDVPRLQRTLRSFAREVDALNPPAEVEDLHGRLVAAVRSLAGDLPKLADELGRTKDPAAVIAALFGAESVQALIRLQQEYQDKGYDISSLLDAGSGP